MDLAYSYEVLEETPERVTQFLSAVGAVPEIRTLLYGAGMDDEEIITGRNLLLNCLAAPLGKEPSRDTPQAKEKRQAQAEIDQLDEEIFTRTSAVLTRFYPSARDYIFRDLKASRGAASVKGMATYLARLEALEKGTDPERQATIKEDAAAVALLVKRGIGPQQRQHWRQLIDIALGPAPTLPPPMSAIDPEERWQKLASLKRWYDDWATTARSIIRKRNHLIRLGLAKRRYNAKNNHDTTEAIETTVVGAE